MAKHGNEEENLFAVHDDQWPESEGDVKDEFEDEDEDDDWGGTSCLWGPTTEVSVEDKVDVEDEFENEEEDIFPVEDWLLGWLIRTNGGVKSRN